MTGQDAASTIRRVTAAGAALLVAGLVAGCGAEPWLVDVAAERGLTFIQSSGTHEGHFMPQITGGGVALFDYDGDGDLDVYLTNANNLLPRIEAEPGTIDRLFRQEADGRFVDVTLEAGLGDPYFSMGVAIGDYDNDGHMDVFVTNYGPDQLYRNRGDGTFENVTAAAGIDLSEWSSGAVFADIDRDGYLDLFVGQYVHFDAGRRCTAEDGTPNWCGPSVFQDRPDVLLRNRGDGTFEDISAASGISGVAASTLGVVADDYDGDGWIDFFVANDGDPAVLWRNNHDGTFSDMAALWGAAVSAMGEPEAGMGIVSDDLDGDGEIDLLVTHVFGEKTTFYRRLGQNLGFLDDSFAGGIGTPSRSVTGFGIVASDFDLDGDLDVFQANGRVRRDQPILPGAIPLPPMDELAEPNHLYLNDGAGKLALLDPAECGGCALVEISRGAITGDFDGDGDEDILVLNLNGPARLFENRAPRHGRWLIVRAILPAHNRAAHGARVTVRAGERAWSRTVHSSTSFFSAREPQVHFGLGAVDAVEAIEVRWPDGTRETFAGTCIDCTAIVAQGQGTVLR